MANLFDAANAPEGEPQEIVVGDFVQWKRSDLVTDYPTDTYTVRYIARISGGGDNEILITGTGQTSHYLFTVLNDDTGSGNNLTVTGSSNFAPGHYFYQLEVERNSDNERIIVDRGHFIVVPDLDVNQADPRSHAEIMLAKIESLLSGKADSDVASYSIAGRSLDKMKFEELVDARNFYKREVLQEMNEIDLKHGRKNSSTIQVRF
jgi:hypothetical protein